jgi:7-keto-8-aminopelargonate synthetase-like enzyme
LWPAEKLRFLSLARQALLFLEHDLNNKSISLADFREISGSTLGERVGPYQTWQSLRRTAGTWVYDKTLRTAPLPVSETIDGCGRQFNGPNYCSQDYLSLASHPLIKEAAFAAIRQLGVHSAGSSALLGNTSLSRKLEGELADFVEYDHALLFPTGWAAGYGVVKGLVRPGDWIVMDVLSHACLQEGAKAATDKIASFPHLDNGALEKRLKRIRANHPTAFILAVTETVFSMDSDTPDFTAFLDICSEYGAVSLVDVAHDLGCLGPTGRGQLEVQHQIGRPDLLIGSFSKTFASNGGFIATNNAGVKEYLKMYSSPQTFSNALSPIQVAIVSAALEIVKSPEGAQRRERLFANSSYLRCKLAAGGFDCLGEPTAIVPVFLGDDELARQLWRTLSNNGLASNFVEFPGVTNNRARIRMQVQSDHLNENADQFVRELTASRASLRTAEDSQILVASQALTV